MAPFRKVFGWLLEPSHIDGPKKPENGTVVLYVSCAVSVSSRLFDSVLFCKLCTFPIALVCKKSGIVLPLIGFASRTWRVGFPF